LRRIPRGSRRLAFGRIARKRGQRNHCGRHDPSPVGRHGIRLPLSSGPVKTSERQFAGSATMLDVVSTVPQSIAVPQIEVDPGAKPVGRVTDRAIPSE